MAIKRMESSISVVDASRQRIRNVFSNGTKVYMAFSAGKDSLVMSHLVYDLIVKGEIDGKRLTVMFIDEEAIYESMYQMALRWRKRFISVEAEFRWYCLPVRQVSMLHQLQNDEQWITWEPGKEDCWVRQPPPFAIVRDPHLNYPGEMNYQTFCAMIVKDGIQLVGVRASESLQRMQYLSKMQLSKGNFSGNNIVYPIYDWKDSDVWLYIKENRLDFPEAYMNLYRVGVQKHQLRLCNFFASESIQGLRHIAETDNELWQRIEKREPNAYLTLLYWDSEMFHRSTRKRRELEGDEVKKDYKELVREMLFVNPDKYFTNDNTRVVAKRYRNLYVKNADVMTQDHFKRMYESLRSGDPKLRTLRALYTVIYTDYIKSAKSTDPRREVK